MVSPPIEQDRQSWREATESSPLNKKGRISILLLGFPAHNHSGVNCLGILSHGADSREGIGTELYQVWLLLRLTESNKFESWY